MFDDDDLGIKHILFKWTSSAGTTNAIRINYNNKDDLRFEVLKMISAHDKMEYECELPSAKEKLVNVEVKQKKSHAGLEQGISKNEDNMLVVIHRDMILYGK